MVLGCSSNMPAQQAATTGGGQGQQQAQQKSNPIFGILRMIAMWYMFKTFLRRWPAEETDKGGGLCTPFPEGHLPGHERVSV